MDCPQCGRSLRVPELDGRTRKLPPTVSEFKTDSGLISALSELSALGEETEPQDHVASTSTATAVQAPTAMPQRVETVAVPLERIDDLVVQADGDEDGPFMLAESLEELAGISDPDIDEELSDELLTEMQLVSHPSASPLLLMFGGMLLLLGGTAAGWWLGKSDRFNPQAAPAVDTAPDAIADSEVDDGAGQPVAEVLSGTVTYVDTAAVTQPDSGALILSLPEEHEGSFRLHAKAFLKAPSHPDRVATLAALEAIGGAVTVADSSGQFVLNPKQMNNSVVFAVSRHKARAADVPIDDKAAVVLDRWFDSTSHICGKLAVQIHKVDAATSDMNIQF